MEIPIYLFTGFLEAGKTKVVMESMEDPNFNEGENTLILLCEEGVEEYNIDSLPNKNVFIYAIEDESELCPETFAKIEKKFKFERMVIEYNGMWMLDSLYRNLPDNYTVYQEICVSDSTTFSSYNSNMRQLVADKLKSCDLMIFNRVTEKTDKMALHKAVRALSTRTNIVYEYTDGSVENDDIRDPLPFDVNASVIEIKDKDYALFYRDVVENRKNYDGKTVRFLGIIAKDPKIKNGGTSVIGRHIMTCCVNDIAYQGFIFHSGNEDSFNTRDWAIIEGKIKMEKHALYQGEGPVIYATSVTPAEKPEEEVATYY